MTEVKTPLLDALAKHILFVFDSCFAGTIFTTRAADDPPRTYTPDIVKRLWEKPSRDFITAGRANERVPANSPISGFFVAALNGQADRYGHGVISAREIHSYLRDRVLQMRIALTPQQGRLPEPDFAEGEFLFRVMPPPPSPAPQPQARLSPTPETAAPRSPAPGSCRNTEDFASWLASFKKEATAKGISQATMMAASSYLVFDQRIINIDRGQRFFAQNFLEIADKMLPASRLTTGASQIKKYQAVFAREEKEFGVPASVITAFWGLESDFGASQGNDNALKSLVTLAYDCRRSEMFRRHLFDALRLIERGDLRAEEMVGSWAGELGQTQMMPSEYLAYAVDYDGDGRRNLIRSVPDVIGSTGKYLAHLGWRRGEPWLQEVRVPANFPWQESDLVVQHARSKWAAWGVTQINGKPLPADNMPASVMAPVGRFGPAFLVYSNIEPYLKWNQSLNYSLTAAYYATRLEGAPPMNADIAKIPKITFDEVREVQDLLQKRGYDIGRIDGVLNPKSRFAIKDVQVKFGMPADSWPTAELLARLRDGR